MNFIFIVFLFHFISSNTILKIGLSNSSIYFHDICSIYEIKTNYKHISLKISNFTNINYIFRCVFVNSKRPNKWRQSMNWHGNSSLCATSHVYAAILPNSLCLLLRLVHLHCKHVGVVWTKGRQIYIKMRGYLQHLNLR